MYYDKEAGLYYLQSRYYETTTQRFINADDTSVLEMVQDDALGANLYTYCSNNPVMNADPSGYIKLSAFWTGIALDVALWSLCPYFAATYDGLGIALKVISLRYGRKYAIDFLSKNIVPTVIYGMLNPLMTAISKATYRFAGIVVNNFTSSIIGWAVGKLSGSIQYLPMFFSPGSFISGVLDYISDGKYDNKIYIHFIKRW